MAISQGTAQGYLNGRFTRMWIDVSGSNAAATPPVWVLMGGELMGKWTIDPQLEDYTNKDSDAIVYYPSRYKWNGSFDTSYLDDDTGQTMARCVVLSAGQSTPIQVAWAAAPIGVLNPGYLTAPGPVVRIAWSIQQDIQFQRPSVFAFMVGLAALKTDIDTTDSKMGKYTVTFTGSSAISLDVAVDPGT